MEFWCLYGSSLNMTIIIWRSVHCPLTFLINTKKYWVVIEIPCTLLHLVCVLLLGNEHRRSLPCSWLSCSSACSTKNEWYCLCLCLCPCHCIWLVNPNNNLAILLGRYVIFLFRKQQTRVVGRVFLSVCIYSTYRSLNMLPTEQKLVEQHFLVGCPQLGQQHMSRQSNI